MGYNDMLLFITIKSACEAVCRSCSFLLLPFGCVGDVHWLAFLNF